jgi:hypothetical protein
MQFGNVLSIFSAGQSVCTISNFHFCFTFVQINFDTTLLIFTLRVMMMEALATGNSLNRSKKNAIQNNFDRGKNIINNSGDKYLPVSDSIASRRYRSGANTSSTDEYYLPPLMFK